MLLALTLTAVVVAVTGRIAVQSLEHQKYVEREASTSHRAQWVFDQLGIDMARILFELAGETFPITLFGTPRQVLQLSALAAGDVDTGNLHTALRPATIRYRLADKVAADGTWSLVRETVDRTQAGALAVRETIAEGVSEFKIEVFIRGVWSSTLAATEANALQPGAVRVSLRWQGLPETQSRTYLVIDAK